MTAPTIILKIIAGPLLIGWLYIANTEENWE